MRFVLIDRVETLEPGRRAVGSKTFAPDEAFFRDHFPGFPVVPGVLVLETMAQLGGRLIQASLGSAADPSVLPMLAMIERAQFRRPIRPGERLDVVAEIESLGAVRARVAGSVEVAGAPAASAQIVYVLVSLEHNRVGLPEAAVDEIRAWNRGVWQGLVGGGGTGPVDGSS